MRKTTIFFLNAIIIFASYAEQPTSEKLKKMRSVVAEQAIMAQACATLLESNFVEDKLDQAGCCRIIKIYFGMIRELHEVEAQLESKNMSKA